MNYNQKRHIELLKRSQSLKNEGKSFYYESLSEYLEFSKYQGAIQSYIYWKSRISFVLLMEKFVDGIITGDEFNDSFFELSQNLIYEYDDSIKKLDSEKLKNF